MNNILKAIFDSYEKEKENIRKKAEANKNTIAALNKELDNIYTGCENLVEKINARKENKGTILELEKKLTTAYENKTILNTALKVANEMQVKTAANALRNEILSSPEKWTKYPIHFKKFQDMVQEFLKDSGLSLYHSYYSYYISGCYEYNDINAYVFCTNSEKITPEAIKEMENMGDYNIIAANDILTECKKAFKARAKIIETYEKAKKAIDDIRSPFSDCSTFYYILPYANSSPENYKHLYIRRPRIMQAATTKIYRNI